MKKKVGIGVGLTIAAVLTMMLGIEILLIILGATEGAWHLPGTAKIAVLEVEGVIYDAQRYNEFIIEQRKDDSVVALLVRIDSPGGSASASQEIYACLKRFRESGKPIIVSIGGMGASGGYYVASVGDKIYANPSSQVGSIGVLLSYMNFGELLRKVGIRDMTLAVGDMKDVPSLTRDLTPEEEAYLLENINDVHDQFINDVAAYRPLTAEELRPLADGRVFTGRQGLANGLVDALGTYEDAQEEVARVAGIDGEPSWVYMADEEESGWLGVKSLMHRLNSLVPPPEFHGGILFQYGR